MLMYSMICGSSWRLATYSDAANGCRFYHAVAVDRNRSNGERESIRKQSMHLCVYASLHLCIHARMQLCIHASMHPCAHLTFLFMYAAMHICISASLHGCIHLLWIYASMHWCVHAPMHLCILLCIYASMHLCFASVHLCIYARIHPCICDQCIYVSVFLIYAARRSCVKHLPRDLRIYGLMYLHVHVQVVSTHLSIHASMHPWICASMHQCICVAETSVYINICTHLPHTCSGLSSQWPTKKSLCATTG